MDLNKDNLKAQSSSQNHQVEEISDDMLLDVAGGMKEVDALEKWLKFKEKSNKF